MYRDVQLTCELCGEDAIVEVPARMDIKDWACDNVVRCEPCKKIEDCYCGETPRVEKAYSGEWEIACDDCCNYCYETGPSGPRAWGHTLEELAEEWNEVIEYETAQIGPERLAKMHEDKARLAARSSAGS